MENIITRLLSRLIDGDRGAITQNLTLRMSPQMVHGIQLRRGLREQSYLDGAGRSHPPAAGAGVLARAVLEQHDIPASPMVPDQVEKMLVLDLGPSLRDQQQYLAAVDVQRPMKDAPGMAAANRDARLLADVPVAAIERWRFRDDRFVEHQQDGTLPRKKTAF